MEDQLKMLKFMIEIVELRYADVPNSGPYINDIKLLMNTVENLHEETTKGLLAAMLGSFMVAGPAELLLLKLLTVKLTLAFMEGATKILGPNVDLANLKPVGEA